VRRRTYLATVVGCGVVGTAGCSALRGQDAEDLDPETISDQTHEGVNERRTAEGVSTLAYDEELEAIAEAHSKDMYERDYFSHEDPSGNKWTKRYQEAGYDCKISIGGGKAVTGGENIWQISYSGRQFTEVQIAERCVTAWMESDEHRKNMLQEYWNREGIGVHVGESDDGGVAVNVTQNFC
jgi:uncharacterized protein YkwD